MLPHKTAKYARHHLAQRIEALLERWTSTRRQPDSWESYFLAQAIDHLARGAYVQGEGDVSRAEDPKTWSEPKLKPADPLMIAELRAQLASALETT